MFIHDVYSWLTKQELTVKLRALHYLGIAEVAELADALRSGRSDPCGHVGSIPTFGIQPLHLEGFFFVSIFLAMRIIEEAGNDMRMPGRYELAEKYSDFAWHSSDLIKLLGLNRFFRPLDCLRESRVKV